MEIITEKPTSISENTKAIIYGFGDLYEDAGLSVPNEDIGSTGYYIKTKGNTVFIQANGGDGYYYVLNSDGTTGGRIYVDMKRGTAFFPNNSLYDTARADKNKDVEKRNFYINGVDYTDVIIEYGRLASNREDENVMLDGFIELDKTLLDALIAITQSERFEGISDSWQMLCYYERTIGTPENS